MQVEINEGEVRAEPVMVLRDAPVSHLVEAEDAFQDAEHMFYFCSYFRLRRAVGRAACACRPPRPPTSIPNAPRPACCPPRYAPSDRSTIDCPSWSDASPGRARRWRSWSTKAHG